MNTTTWILVASSSEAHIYSSPRAKLFKADANLDHIEDFSHPECRAKEADLVTDKPGHNAHGTYVKPTLQKTHESVLFAQTINKALNQARLENQFDDLIVVAAPPFDGILNKEFNKQLNQKCSVHISKDYTQHSEKALLALLQNHL